MKVHEADARHIFSESGLPVPPSRIAATAGDAAAAASAFNCPVVVKALVLAGGRGKAGGVTLADSPEAAREAAHRILQLAIKGEPVRRVLVAPAVNIEREIYLGVTIDRAAQSAVVIASSSGGIDIEETSARTPEAIRHIQFDTATGVDAWQARAIGFDLGLNGRQVTMFAEAVRSLVDAFLRTDASLAEVNPLVVDTEGELWAIDAKLNIDDNALYRRPELASLRDTDAEDPAEARAREAGISYIKLTGDIGCMVNGAGLAMATMDIVKHHGGEPANFLDVGGGASVQQVATALDIIVADPNVRAVFVNIFGGITRADDVARGVLEARASMARGVPLVVRLVGTNETEGLKLLADAGVSAERSMDAAARRVVEVVS